MASNAAGTVSSKLSLGLLNFILAVISGWALKHYSIERHALAGYGLFFAHSVLCILRYTHPNPGQVQRRICEQSLRYSPAIFITLIIGQMQSISGELEFFAGIAKWRHIVLTLYGGVLLLSGIRRCLSEKSSLGQLLGKLLRLNHTVCVLWNIYCLWRIAMLDEHWWSLGLALLVLLNHFVLWRLSLRFNISTLEVDTVGMCFSLIFAINASQELIENTAGR
ncbi:uncharacterized protein LOC133848555 [Drosophila sulfurigaster albostrigata]|uniref:uncharacterized protein LOC133848555 n=1 Tax=Drosophila sulfurigaster albostrigata TaxID=89887 RepID=UPI002D21C593|nr:uncharacterized protein LOC133848555 [Drosophila sulfurigaster albostrigata]